MKHLKNGLIKRNPREGNVGDFRCKNSRRIKTPLDLTHNKEMKMIPTGGFKAIKYDYNLTLRFIYYHVFAHQRLKIS